MGKEVEQNPITQPFSDRQTFHQGVLSTIRRHLPHQIDLQPGFGEIPPNMRIFNPEDTKQPTPLPPAA